MESSRTKRSAIASIVLAVGAVVALLAGLYWHHVREVDAMHDLRDDLIARQARCTQSTNALAAIENVLAQAVFKFQGFVQLDKVESSDPERRRREREAEQTLRDLRTALTSVPTCNGTQASGSP